MKAEFKYDDVSESEISLPYEGEQVKVVCKPNRVLIYVQYGDIPEVSRPSVAKYIASVNQKLAFGNWEVSMEDGKNGLLRFKTYFSFDADAMPNMLRMLISCITLGVDTFKLEKQKISDLLQQHAREGVTFEFPRFPRRSYEVLAAARDRNAELVRQLISHGADVNQTDEQGVSALMAAANRGDAAICRMLISARANVNHESDNKDTALSVACFRSMKDAAIVLIESGADVNHTDKFGETPLHDAARTGMKPVVELLLSRGARSVPSTRGETPLRLAINNGHSGIVAVLPNDLLQA